MNLSFTWINILILFGALQALVFCIVLLFQKSPGAKFLAAFIFVLAFNGLETFNWSAGLNHFFFDLSGFVIIFAVGPALYLHVKSVVAPQETIRRSEIFAHFSLFLFQLVTRLLAIGYHLLFMSGIVDNENDFLSLISFTWTHAEPVSMLAFGVYVVVSIRLYKKNTGLSILNAGPAVQRRIEWVWIRSLLIWTAIVAFAWAVTLLVPLFWEVDSEGYYPIELLLVAFTYWVALNGYHKTRLIRIQKSESDLALSMSQPEADAHFRTLKDAMETRKLYLDPKLNLAALSKHTGIPGKIISAVLNQHRESNFNDFVNSYRLKDVCRMLTDSELTERYTISGIALECGFNSQATFQRVFKSKLGVSPREYAQQSMRQSA